MAYVALTPDGEDPDFDTFLQSMLDAFAAEVPGWDSTVTADPIAAILRVFAASLFENRILVGDVGASIFAQVGRTLYRIPSATAAVASLTATVLFSDTFGHTVPAGTEVVYTEPTSGQDLAYDVASQVTVGPGVSSATVTLLAAFPGSDYNVVPAGVPLTLSDVVAGVSSVVALTAAAGGVDAEADEDYLNTLSDNLKTLREVADNEISAAILARNVPGVHRSFAIGGWNPVNDTLNNDMDVGIVFLDEAGADVAAPVKTAGVAYLMAPERRGLNIVLRAGAPTYTRVQVAFTAKADNGFSPTAVKTAAEQAVRDFIDPAYWSGGRLVPAEWRGENIVRYLDVVGIVSRVPGIASLQTLTLNGTSADVTLAGRAPLPTSFSAATNPSTVVGTVTAL